MFQNETIGHVLLQNPATRPLLFKTTQTDCNNWINAYTKLETFDCTIILTNIKVEVLDQVNGFTSFVNNIKYIVIIIIPFII